HRTGADLLSRHAPDRRRRVDDLCLPVRREELFGVGALHVAHQGRHQYRPVSDTAAGGCHLVQGLGAAPGRADLVSYELIAALMFSSMMLLLLTGQRVFAVSGFVGAMAALLLWGEGGAELSFTSIMKVMKWYPLLTLP